MPGWMDILNGLTQPLVPKKAIQPAQDWLEEPSLDRSPLEAGLRGFASGALEGVRGLTTPLDIAGLAAGGLGAAARGAGRIGRMAPEVAQAFDIISESPVRQIKPSMGAVNDLLGEFSQTLKGVPQATGKLRRPTTGAVEGLRSAGPRGMYPNMPAEFTPRGGEALYNSVRRPGF